MKLITKVLPRNHNLFLFGDLHVGSTLFYEKGWNEFLNMINSSYKSCQNNYGICHGDIMETIMIDDPRYQPEATKGDPLVQMDAVTEMLRPIANKLLVLIEGNHEYKLWRFGRIADTIAKRLGVDYGTYSCHITYEDKDGHRMYKHYATHGSKGIASSADDIRRQEANMKLILKRHMKNKFGDTILNSKGHSHKLLICDPSRELYLKVKENEIVEEYKVSNQAHSEIHPDHKWYVNTGSFMRLYGNVATDEAFSGYAERWELNPVELGFAIAVVRDGIIQSVDKVVL